VTDTPILRIEPPCLFGSRDPGTGQTYFPPRQYAADGSLRQCERLELSSEGTLYTWTEFSGEGYGQVDLPEGVRVQTRLVAGEHEIGARYRLVTFVDSAGKESYRFGRA
jgi:uncharacterized OB-fold protein